MKKILGILGIVISIIGFSLYYPIAVETDPNIPYVWIKICHYSLFVGLALISLSIGINSEKRIKNLIHYTGFAFWFTVFICYLLKDFGMIKSRDMSIYFLIGTTIVCLTLYFCKRFK